jgi:hypothetical protein
MSSIKIKIIKELIDKKVITFEQALILLDIKIDLESPVNFSTNSCTGNCDNCSCKK